VRRGRKVEEEEEEEKEEFLNGTLPHSLELTAP